MILLLLCAAAGAYQALALLASLVHLHRREQVTSTLPGVSILKPVHGSDSAFYRALKTHAAIVYPEWEILFGVQTPEDSAWRDIEHLTQEHPEIAVTAVLTPTEAPNAKAGVLGQLAARAKYPIIVINDADISVPPDYLNRLVGALWKPSVGLVTCLYRASADSPASTLEALGIATDFAPSALVAPLVGVKEFGLGSTLALRSEVLAQIGNFSEIRDYIADDYQVGKRVHALGLKVLVLSMPISTHLSGSWRHVWNHQVRWARTIRLAKSGYYGLPITNATIWALIAAISGHWVAAAVLLSLRLVVGIFVGVVVLCDPITKRWWSLMPVRDLLGFAVWCAGAFGREVRWSGSVLTLDRLGRITRKVDTE